MSVLRHAIRVPAAPNRHWVGDIESICGAAALPGLQGTSAVYHNSGEYQHLLCLPRIGQFLPRDEVIFTMVQPVAQVSLHQGSCGKLGAVFQVHIYNLPKSILENKFMTFWQKMVLGLIVNLRDQFETQDQANHFIMQSQNFLICLEMLFSAVAHVFVFSPDEWAPGYREREEERRRTSTSNHAFGDSVALGDFIDDVKIVLASKKRRRKRNNTLSPNSSVSGDDDATIESTENEDVAIHTPEEDRTNGLADMRNFTIDEDKEGISSTPPARSGTRPRLDTDDSHPGEVGESLRRMENFILEHTSPKSDKESKMFV